MNFTTKSSGFIMSVNKINLLLSELGPSLDLNRITNHDDQIWTLIFDDEQEIDIQYLESQETLLISSAMTVDERDNEQQLFKLLLEYNFLYKDTGGVQFALNPGNSDVILQVSTQLNVDISQLANLILQLKELTISWSEFIRDRDETSAVESDDNHNFFLV